MTDEEQELEVQRGRADRAYQHLAQCYPSAPDWGIVSGTFHIEHTRLIALELRWANREVAT